MRVIGGLACIVTLLGALGGCVERAVGLDATGRVTGRLQTMAGAGLPGTIRLSGPIEAALLAADDGGFAFERVPVGTYLVAGTASDTREGAVTASVIVEANAEQPVVLKLTGIGSVRGSVLLEGDDGDLAGTRVVVGGASATTLTSFDGRFEMKALPEGTHALFALREGWEPAPLGTIEIERGATVELPPRSLTKTSSLTTSIHGVATVPGATDHSGIEVRVAGTDVVALTTADGSYELVGVPVGLVSLSFRRGPYTGVLSPLLASTTTPPLVLARSPYALPTLDLTYGERLPYDGSVGVTVMKTIGQRVYAIANVGLVAIDDATGVSRTLAQARLLAVTADGAQIVALRTSSPSVTTSDLVRWDPVSGDETILATGVGVAQLLPLRQEVLVTSPSLRVVPIDGSAIRSFPFVRMTSWFDLAKDETSLLTTTTSGPQQWIDLVTGTIWYDAAAGEWATWAGGYGLIIQTTTSTSFLKKGASAKTQLGSSRSDVLGSAPDGRALTLRWSNETHLVDCATGTKIATTTVAATTQFSPDSGSWIVTKPRADGMVEVVVHDVPSGVAHPALAFASAPMFYFFGRYAVFLAPNADGSMRVDRLALDTNAVTTIVPQVGRLSRFGKEYLHYLPSLDSGTRTKVIEVATGTVRPHDYPGFAINWSSDEQRLILRIGDRVSLFELATGLETPILETPRDTGDSPLFIDDETLLIKRYLDDYNVTIAPEMQIGEGWYLGSLPKQGQP